MATVTWAWAWASAVLPGSAIAQPAPDPCHTAAIAAERAAGLPAGMLDAIGQVETGPSGPSGQAGWPWSVDAAGEDRRFASLAEAAQYVRERQRAGLQSIDVGCFQINLMYHPDAFQTLEQAFDPASNAAYAARFLTELRRRAGDWDTAVALYHSATPTLGAPYRAQVLARWIGESAVSAVPDPVVIRLLPLPPPAVRVWTPGSAAAPAGPALPRVLTPTR